MTNILRSISLYIYIILISFGDIYDHLNECKNPHLNNKLDIHVSSGSYEDSGYGIGLDVLTILCESRSSYPRRSMSRGGGEATIYDPFALGGERVPFNHHGLNQIVK